MSSVTSTPSRRSRDTARMAVSGAFRGDRRVTTTSRNGPAWGRGGCGTAEGPGTPLYTRRIRLRRPGADPEVASIATLLLTRTRDAAYSGAARQKRTTLLYWVSASWTWHRVGRPARRPPATHQ